MFGKVFKSPLCAFSFFAPRICFDISNRPFRIYFVCRSIYISFIFVISHQTTGLILTSESCQYINHHLLFAPNSSTVFDDHNTYICQWFIYIYMYQLYSDLYLHHLGPVINGITSIYNMHYFIISNILLMLSVIYLMTLLDNLMNLVMIFHLNLWPTFVFTRCGNLYIKS